MVFTDTLKINFELASNSSGRQIERATIKAFELAEEKDHIDVTYILASSVVNGNGALFTKEELEAAKETIINQPLIIVPDWDGKPTGHSIDDFPAVGWDGKIIGTHVKSEIVEENDVTHLKTTARVWKIRYPELATTMLSLHSVGDLKFSMESKYNSQTIEGSTRTLHGVSFIGSAVVDDPANPFSYSLEAANKNNKEEKFSMNLEQALAKIGQLEGEIANLQKSEGTLKTEVSTLTDSLKSANTNIDTLKGEVATYQEKEKQTAAQELANKRFSEMAKFVDYSAEEKASKMESFASMSEDVFAIVLETASRNKPQTQTSNETAGVTSDTSLNTPKGFLDGLE
jgi:hypothetical protein